MTAEPILTFDAYSSDPTRPPFRWWTFTEDVPEADLLAGLDLRAGDILVHGASGRDPTSAVWSFWSAPRHGDQPDQIRKSRRMPWEKVVEWFGGTVPRWNAWASNSLQCASSPYLGVRHHWHWAHANERMAAKDRALLGMPPIVGVHELWERWMDDACATAGPHNGNAVVFRIHRTIEGIFAAPGDVLVLAHRKQDRPTFRGDWRELALHEHEALRQSERFPWIIDVANQMTSPTVLNGWGPNPLERFLWGSRGAWGNPEGRGFSRLVLASGAS